MVSVSNHRQDFLTCFLSSIVCWMRGMSEHKEIIIPFNCGTNSAVIWTHKRKRVRACAWANSLAGQNELVFIAFSIQSPCQFPCSFFFYLCLLRMLNMNNNSLLCHHRIHNEFMVCENITICRFLEMLLLICILMHWSLFASD